MAKTYSEVVKIDSSAAAPLYVSSSVANPVHVSASTSNNNPLVVTFATTAVQTVTASQANPLSITGSVALLDSYLTSIISDVVEVTASSANPVYMSASQENPVSVAAKFVDTTGSAIPIKANAAGYAKIVAVPYYAQVAEGNELDRKIIHKTGYATGVNATLVNVWNSGSGGAIVYNFPPSGGIQLQIRSTSTDDAVAGKGIETIKMTYLDKDYVEKTETISLAGTTFVPTVATDIRRINAFYATSTGVLTGAAGNILVRDMENTGSYAFISQSRCSSRQAIYTVPRNKTFYMLGWDASAGYASNQTRFVQVSLATNSDWQGNLLNTGSWHIKDTMILANSVGNAAKQVPFKIPGTADVRVMAQADSEAVNAVVACSFNGWEETN